MENNSTPRILHVSTPKSWRGGEQQLAYLAAELREKNVFQHFLCRKNGELAVFLEREGFSFTAKNKTTGFDFRYARELAVQCKMNNIDCIHTHDSHAHTAAVLAADLFCNKAPLVVSRRVDFPVSGSFFSRYKYNHNKIAAILCVSNRIKEITAASLADVSKLQTVYSGVDLERYQNVIPANLHKEYSIPANRKIVGNIAALAPHKDYPTFISSAEALLRENNQLQFFIVGSGPSESEIKAGVNRSAFSNHFTMTGFRKDVLSVLKSFEVFLITSETEGLGTSIIDAFGCGIPVVATRAGGIPELVKHGVTGLSAPVKDTLALARETQRLLTNQKLADELKKGALEKLQDFTKEQTAAQTLSVYRKIANQQ